MARPVEDIANVGLDAFAPYLMNRIIGRYNSMLADKMAEIGLTTAQMRIIAVLAVQDGISIGKLAVFSVVETSTLSRALNALEQTNLVRRETDLNDSRATRIFLKPAGKEAYENLWPKMANAHDAMFDGIEDVEKDAFIQTLKSILKNVRKHDF